MKFSIYLYRRVFVMISDKAYDEAKMRTQEKQRAETLGDPWAVKQYHWNTGANENHHLNPDEPRNRHKSFRLRSSDE